MKNSSNPLPDFLVIGGEKCGTTWLYHQLKNDSFIGVPETKEIHFFSSKNSFGAELKNYEKGIDWYSNFFRKIKDKKIIGEVTPLYLSDLKACERIYNSLPKIKLVVILRNPIDRFVSHYNMAINKKQIAQSRKIEDLITENHPIFTRGLYDEHLARYLKKFSRKKILILSYEELFSIEGEIKLKKFLEVPILSNTFKFEDKIYSSPRFRSLRLFLFLGKIAKQMHAKPISQKIWLFAKKTGIVGIIKTLFIYSKKGYRYKISKAERMIIYSAYKISINNLEKLLNQKFDWK